MLVVALSPSLFAVGTWEGFQQPLVGDCTAVECNPIEITSPDAARLRGSEMQGALHVVVPVLNLLLNSSFIVVALFLAWRKSDDWMALLLSATLFVLGAAKRIGTQGQMRAVSGKGCLL